jgi:hypothetical protein
MTLAETQDRLRVFSATEAEIKELLDAVLRHPGHGTMSTYLMSNPFVLRITWCRKNVPGPPTPLHTRAQPIMWLGVTANTSP